MLFRRKIDRHCSYCAHGAKIDEERCLCAKKGIVSASHRCRKFRYDPLKRVPPRMKPQDFQKYDDVDFSL